MRSLVGNAGIGQVRYPTAGSASSEEEAQPFYVSAPYGIILAHNGNLTNAPSLRVEMAYRDRRHINTSSDTEVLLKLYAEHGIEMLHMLRGMFAFAIWDTVAKKLILARDRMGVKPLYYAFYQNAIYFASEQKALFTAGVPLEISENGLDEYFFNRFVAGENTLYNRVKKVLPGHYMVLENNGYTTFKKWWNLKSEIENTVD
jgi:asparagine synthase (glutamine-hydrolysing)